ncbi:unnamed protein product [Rhodiola kirilowii]
MDLKKHKHNVCVEGNGFEEAYCQGLQADANHDHLYVFAESLNKARA